MQTIFIKPEFLWNEETWAAYNETFRYCREHRLELKEYGDRFEIFIPTITDYCVKRLSELEDSFDARVSGSFVCSFGWPMQFDRSDTLAVEGAIQLMRANGQTEGYLTDANDETHYDLPLATIEAVKLEMLAAYAACHARKQELRAAINAAQTEEELNAIQITWPV